MTFATVKSQSQLANITAYVRERQGRVSKRTVAEQFGISRASAGEYLAEIRRHHPNLLPTP